MAVDLAKVSLWLVTLAKDHALTFVDHALRHGDSLVGLSRRQIENFHWDTSVTYDSPFRARMRDQVARVAELRRRIREAGEDVSDAEPRRLWDQAQAELDTVRLYGDLVVSAFFEAEKSKDRERRRSDYVASVVRDDVARHALDLQMRREADPPLVPFHSEIEFPEVFGRKSSGFDAIVGNPPFAQKNAIAQGQPSGYVDYLRQTVERTNGKCDLVAFFFRRSFHLLRSGGTLGLLATNTLAQGDTRAAGLTPIAEAGGSIYSARRRIKWPGAAAVVTSLVHISKHMTLAPISLDGKKVRRISAYLVEGDLDADPAHLVANADRAFHGVDPSGTGFTFDDDEEGAHSLDVMRRVLARNPTAAERILPYIGGEEVNRHPLQEPRRFIISFGKRDLGECKAAWPELVDLVEKSVKPDRESRPSNAQAKYLCSKWWQWHTDRPTLKAALIGKSRALVNSQVSPHLAFAFQPHERAFALTLNVFVVDTFAALCTLQSRPHEIWARFFGSSMKDDLRYTPSDCFETFPFPINWESDPTLDSAGQAYFEFRAALMVRNNEGLTKTYNRFHDPDERDPDILKLRDFHAAMDRAVLDAYGWHDILTDCAFLLDYEIDEDEWSEKRKKPWRYRWPDDVRDEVLARLLELNAERAREETLAGAAGIAKPTGKRTQKATSRKRSPGTEDLFS